MATTLSQIPSRSGWPWIISLLIHLGIVATFALSLQHIEKWQRPDSLDTRTATPHERPDTLALRIEDEPIVIAAEKPPVILPPPRQTSPAPKTMAQEPRSNNPMGISLVGNPGSPAPSEIRNNGTGSGAGTGTGAPVATLHPSLKAGKSIVYLLDRSSSMSGDKLRRAEAALVASLKQLQPGNYFQIVVYNGRAENFGTQQNALIPATPEALQQAQKWLSQVFAEGSSNHVEGFRQALRFQSDALFFLTDADDLTESEVRQIRGWVRHPVSIHGAIFSNPQARENDSALERLTHSQRGAVRYYALQKITPTP